MKLKLLPTLLLFVISFLLGAALMYFYMSDIPNSPSVPPSDKELLNLAPPKNFDEIYADDPELINLPPANQDVIQDDQKEKVVQAALNYLNKTRNMGNRYSEKNWNRHTKNLMKIQNPDKGVIYLIGEYNTHFEAYDPRGVDKSKYRFVGYEPVAPTATLYNIVEKYKVWKGRTCNIQEDVLRELNPNCFGSTGELQIGTKLAIYHKI